MLFLTYLINNYALKIYYIGKSIFFMKCDIDHLNYIVILQHAQFVVLEDTLNDFLQYQTRISIWNTFLYISKTFTILLHSVLSKVIKMYLKNYLPQIIMYLNSFAYPCKQTTIITLIILSKEYAVVRINNICTLYWEFEYIHESQSVIKHTDRRTKIISTFNGV